MPYHDLNLPCVPPASTAAIAYNIAFASELGYSVIALSLSINGKLPATLPSIPTADFEKPPDVTLLTRLTLTISDTSQNHRLTHLSSSYDLVALRPTNEKSFQLCCGSLDCDIISIDFSQRLPFILKFKTVSGALQRGIRFEICYSPGITDGTDARRNTISGATSLIRATRGKGIILSSGAKTALGLRAPYDVMNLVQVWGLGQERGKEAVCEEADRVVRLARLRRETYRGVIRVLENGGPSTEEGEQATKAAEERDLKAGAEIYQPIGTKTNKRKASNSLLDAPDPTQQPAEKPLSKKQQKKLAKKARFDALNPDKTTDQDPTAIVTNNSFPIKHEVLLSASSKGSKKS